LVFGLRKSLWGSFSAGELVERVHGEGGIIIAAHPYKLSRGGKNHYYGAGNLIYQLALDAVDITIPGIMTGAGQSPESHGRPGTPGYRQQRRP